MTAIFGAGKGGTLTVFMQWMRTYIVSHGAPCIIQGSSMWKVEGDRRGRLPDQGCVSLPSQVKVDTGGELSLDDMYLSKEA